MQLASSFGSYGNKRIVRETLRTRNRILGAEDCCVLGRGVNFLRPASNMKDIARIVLVVALGFLNGCGSSSQNFTMTGTWVFSLKPAASPSQVIQLTADLTQINDTFFGQVTLTGEAASCGINAQMSGTVNGNTVAIQILQNQTTLTFKGKTNDTLNSSAGSYTATSGQCIQNGGTGTWSGFLKPPNSSSFEAKSD